MTDPEVICDYLLSQAEALGKGIRRAQWGDSSDGLPVIVGDDGSVFRLRVVEEK